MWRLTQQTAEVSEPFKAQALRAWEQMEKQSLAYRQLPFDERSWADIELRGKELRRDFKRLVVLGIGGSALGARAIHGGLYQPEQVHQLEVVDHIDGKSFRDWIRSLRDFDDIHWLVVSKSGQTLETLALAEYVDQHLRQTGFKRLGLQSTVITSERASPLGQWAQRENVRTLNLPNEIGGRFSVLTSVGLLPASFLGYNLQKFREGAIWALDQKSLVCDLTAQTLSSFQRGEYITLFWPYTTSFTEMTYWIQQLWSESLAKKVTRNGAKPLRVSTPLPCFGARDQHSILQQIIEGERDKFIWFLRSTTSESEGPVLEKPVFDNSQNLVGRTLGNLLAIEADATLASLSQNSVQSLSLVTDIVDESSVGAFFMIMQQLISVLGEVLNINVYDQPGVELAKKLTKDRLLEPVKSK